MYANPANIQKNPDQIEKICEIRLQLTDSFGIIMIITR